MKFVDIRAWIKQTKLGYLWWFFQGSRNLLGDEYRRLKYFREKIYQQSLSDLDHGLKNKSKFRASSEQSVSHFRFPSICVTVVFLRRLIRCKFLLWCFKFSPMNFAKFRESRQECESGERCQKTLYYELLTETRASKIEGCEKVLKRGNDCHLEKGGKSYILPSTID